MDDIDRIIMNGATESCCDVVSIKPDIKLNINNAIFIHHLYSVILLLLYFTTCTVLLLLN